MTIAYDRYGLDEPEVHTEVPQTEQEGTFPFQADVDGFLSVDCTRILDQKANLRSQADVGVKSKKATTAQVAAHQEFARLPNNRQQRGMIGWRTEQTELFDPRGLWNIHSFLPGVKCFCVSLFAVLFCFSRLKISPRSVGSRGEKGVSLRM